MHVTTTEEDKEGYGIYVLGLERVGKGVWKAVVSNVTRNLNSVDNVK